ncbi:male sterility protein [Stylonychia lemnae]|uniref:Male sterility protein n=1 Tax=Stylonychia lemnae TaxID=5949 RepID=A0A078AE71_STYLE|nr:male sterility protein [Stylonychia lemnae]|eukprot:CDW80559.1 male sterility protein [Stylonychia lemnae]
MIRDFYRDKTLLITGTTGFLGKVVLEKFFRSLSEFKKIYLLVRPKKGTKPMDRVKREILQSPCFDVVRKMPQYDEIINSKIFPIEGDITKDNLALSQSDRQTLINELDVVINCAASVDFNERLCDALQINYFGCHRMYELASQCKNLAVFTHVSTCYTNCEKRGFIKEQIYDIGKDPEQVIDDILRMTPQLQDQNLQQILGEWPNTYTFTKSMAERTLQKIRRPDIPVVILRPSIIGGSLSEPLVGWTDTFSAAGGLSVAVGLGLVNFIKGHKNNISDIVPVDIVSNAIIVSTALGSKRQELKVVHCGTSHLNPITWGQYMEFGFQHIAYEPLKQQVFKPSVKFVPDSRQFQTYFYLKNELPSKIYKKIAQIPGIGGQQMLKDATKLEKINNRSKIMGEMFEHFTLNEWIYESNQIVLMLSEMTESDKVEFNIDPKTINWGFYVRAYIHGMQNYILNEDVINPSQHKAPLIPKNQFTYFEDLKFALLKNPTLTHSDPIRLRHETLQSDHVQDCIHQQLQANKQKLNSLNFKTVTYDRLMKQASKYLNEMQAIIRPTAVRPMLWLVSKIWQRIYDQIIVNEQGLEGLRQLMQQKDQGIILVPTHKSYIDFLLVAYIHYHFKLDLPFTCGDEAFYGVAVAKFFLQSGGGFFSNNKFKEDKLFQSVMSGYIQALMNQNSLIQIFMEKNRSRSGKIQRPSEELFGQILSTYFQGKQNQNRVKDLKFVPVTINYDIVYEGEQFPLELLGESKTPESFARVIKYFSNLNKNIGKVVVKYCEPVSLEAYTNCYLKNNKIEKSTLIADKNCFNNFVDNFGKTLCQTQTDNLVIMVTSLTASILLMHRKGISYDQLLNKIDWLFKEIQARNAELSFNSSPSSAMISTSSLRYLGKFIDQKRNIFEPSVLAKKDFKNLLMLAYYKNNLIHLFINDSEIACCILGYGSILDLQKDYIKIEELQTRYRYLQDLLSEEFVIRKTNKTKDNFLKNLEFMESRGFFQYDKLNQTLKVDINNDQQQYGHAYLCHLLLPYIESYWLTLVYFLTVDNKKSQIDEEQLYNKIQWLAEALFDQGLLKFFESCMLESLRNAIKKYTQMGVLSQKIITKKKESQVFYSLSEEFQDQAKIDEAYEKLIFYMPYPPQVNLPKIQLEIKKIMMSDIQLMPKL